MKYDALQQAATYSKAHKRKMLWLRVVAVLAAVVVFCTTYALILPAITKERSYFCGFEEHQHTDACYEVKQSELVCTVQTHSHAAACVDENGTQICELPEIAEHTHVEMCYAEASSVLVCERQEHTHSETCCIDPNADVEEASEWEATLPQDLTGQWPEDIVAIAASQLGYGESAVNLKADASGVYNGYTRYGAWYGEPYRDWNSLFAMFCLHYTGVSAEICPQSSDLSSWCEALKEASLWKETVVYTPQSGDLLFFGERVGVVAEVIAEDGDGVTLRVIAGDIDNTVQCIELAADDSVIKGAVNMTALYDSCGTSAKKQKQYADERVTVMATYTALAGIPNDAELIVSVIDPSSEEYASCFDEALATLEAANGQAKTAEITDFQLYDICFVHNGTEIEPTAAVDVQITFPTQEATQTANVSVVHYAENGTEMPDVQECTLSDEGFLNTRFETESFSLFAVVTSETTLATIVSLDAYAVTDSNLTALSGNTFAMASGNYGLTVNSNSAPTVGDVYFRDSGSLTADESFVRWSFEKSDTSGVRYILCTTIDSTPYYLALSGTGFSLTADRTTAAVFTAARSDTGLTLQNGDSYVNVSADGLTLGTAQVLQLYTLPSGQFTVVFDGRLGYPTYMSSSNKKYEGGETVTVSSDASGYITLPTPEETAVPGNYPMRLNGWYDIINAVYYDSSMFGQKVKITNNTTFYAEWVAETYDIGQNVDVITGQPNTSDFIDTYMFDYNELFNLQSATYSESTGRWTFDPDSELGFIFFDYLTNGNIAYMDSKDAAVDGITINAEKTNGTRGSSTNFPGTITPGIANEARLEALFGDTPMPGRLSLGEADWLYDFDQETGFYYYNSAKNAAAYNQSEQRFYVYDYTVKIDSNNSLNDFLPFNYGSTVVDSSDGSPVYAEKDNEANYWFGMKSEIDFYLPADNGSVLNKSANGTDLQLRFSGDDDVWIFIDGQLAIDLGGVHDVVYGEVNFVTGKVTTGQAISGSAVADNTADAYSSMPGVTQGAAGVTTTDLPFELTSGNHTITIYYLERGSSLSNCAVYFNLSPSYTLNLTKHDSANAALLAGAEFKIYTDEACTEPAVLYQQDENGNLTQIQDVAIITDENGVASVTGLQAGQIYYIKETKPPPGFPDMSKYVIKVDLNQQGEAVVVAISESGEEFVFADEYIISSDDHTHLVEIDVYNEQHVGGEKELYVEKVWAEGSENLPESITVRLYADDAATNRTLTLNADNGWADVFYELPIEDDEGNTIVYSVKEEPVPSGYSVAYTAITYDKTIETVVPGYFTEVTSFEAGGVYRIVSDASGWVVQGSNSTSVVSATASDDNDAQLWKAVQSGSSWYLQNVAYPTRYLYIANNSVTGSTGTRAITYSGSNGRLYYSSGWRTYYLRDSTSLGGSYRTTTSQNSATAYSLYKWTDESVTTTTETIEGWRITNTPWDEAMSVPVVKQWDDTVSSANRSEIQLTLYRVTEGEETAPEEVATLTLNADNGWAGTFNDLSYPEDGTYYALLEDTEGYRVTYSGDTVSLMVDGVMKDAARVTIGEDGKAAGITVTNARLILLPDTGGSGTLWFTVGGALLIVFAVSTLILILYKRRKGAI